MSEAGVKKAMGMLDQSTRKALGRRRDLTEIKGGKPDRAYVFVRNDKVAMSDAQADGLSPVLVSENAGLEVPAADKVDGAFELGDTVLMETPKTVREALLKENVKRADAQLRRIREDFHNEGRSAGVQTFEETPAQLAEAQEVKKYNEAGRKLFAMGATFDDKGNLVRAGQVIAKTS